MDHRSFNTVSTSAGLADLARALRNRAYQFTTITPATQKLVNARAKNLYARNLVDVFGWNRPFYESALERELFVIAQEAGAVMSDSSGLWRSKIRASTLEECIFLHSAFPTEAADSVFFGPDTVRFCDAVLRLVGELRMVRSDGAGLRALDLGCGSGAAGILLALGLPGCIVTLSDINPAALTLAEVNAQVAGAGNASVVQSDMFSALKDRFDIIVANPPYLLDPAGRIYRHGGGTLGEGMSLRIVSESISRLNPGGCLLLYTGSVIVDGHDGVLAMVRQTLPTSGFSWTYRELDPDVFGEELATSAYTDADRIAAVLLTMECAR